MSADADGLDLVVRAGRAGTREEWLFLLANRSVGVVSYDRASVWSTPGKPDVLTVSGQVDPDAGGAFASAWGKALRCLRRPDQSASLSAEAFSDGQAWREASASVLGLSALWIPVAGQGAGFVFERWNSGFSDEERLRLERLVDACALARAGGGLRPPSRLWRRLAWLCVLLACGAALAFVRLPLRIAAECEVVARNPRLIAAPMDGVVAEIVAEPGSRVAAGEPLAVYDSRMMEEELNILRRQVDVAGVELATARAR
jgi:hypothetical protein